MVVLSVQSLFYGILRKAHRWTIQEKLTSIVGKFFKIIFFIGFIAKLQSPRFFSTDLQGTPRIFNLDTFLFFKFHWPVEIFDYLEFPWNVDPIIPIRFNCHLLIFISLDTLIYLTTSMWCGRKWVQCQRNRYVLLFEWNQNRHQPYCTIDISPIQNHIWNRKIENT